MFSGDIIAVRPPKIIITAAGRIRQRVGAAEAVKGELKGESAIALTPGMVWLFTYRPPLDGTSCSPVRRQCWATYVKNVMHMTTESYGVQPTIRLRHPAVVIASTVGDRLQCCQNTTSPLVDHSRTFRSTRIAIRRAALIGWPALKAVFVGSAALRIRAAWTTRSCNVF